jgi:hypothetical protein
MKSANFVTVTGKRVNAPSGQIEDIYRSLCKRRVRVEYIGPGKTNCKGCGIPFLFIDSGRGRYPNYHSAACKQKPTGNGKRVSYNRKSCPKTFTSASKLTPHITDV